MTALPRTILTSLSALAIAFALSSTAQAQTPQSCGPDHRLTPADHERIMEAIILDASDVVHGIDYREMTLANRDLLILRSALRAEGIPPDVKACIQEVLDQTGRPQAPALSPQDQERLRFTLARIDALKSVEEIESALSQEQAAAREHGAAAVAAGLDAATQVFQAGRERIYNPAFYRNSVERFGTGAPEIVAGRMALNIAKKDMIGAVIGGAFGFLAGPEGVIPGAVMGAVRGSTRGALVEFAFLWFGTG